MGARVPVWVWLLAAIVAAWAISLLVCYDAGKGAERSAMRSDLIRRDSIVADSIERLRKERGVLASAAVAVAAQRDSARTALKREIDAARRTVTVVNTTTVRVVDTLTDSTHDVTVPAAITERITKDSARIDSLMHDNDQQRETIGLLRLQLSADTALLRTNAKMIADLKIEPPKPPLLDRVIARVAVPATKVAIVGGVVYGGWRLLSSILKH